MKKAYSQGVVVIDYERFANRPYIYIDTYFISLYIVYKLKMMSDNIK